MIRSTNARMLRFHTSVMSRRHVPIQSVRIIAHAILDGRAQALIVLTSISARHFHASIMEHAKNFRMAAASIASVMAPDTEAIVVKSKSTSAATPT